MGFSISLGSATADHMDPTTTFDDAMCGVPKLRELCKTVMTGAIPGSGIKLLRLVSKQLGVAMLGPVQAYTLTLDGHAGSDTFLHQMSLLESTLLTRLRVTFVDNTTGGWGEVAGFILRGWVRSRTVAWVRVTGHDQSYCLSYRTQGLEC